jgi:hypothetical protein
MDLKLFSIAFMAIAYVLIVMAPTHSRGIRPM